MNNGESYKVLKIKYLDKIKTAISFIHLNTISFYFKAILIFHNNLIINYL